MELAVSDLISHWKAHSGVVQNALKRQLAFALLRGSDDQAALTELMTVASVNHLPNLVMLFRPSGCGQLLAEMRQAIFASLEEMLANEQEALVTIMGRDNILLSFAGEQDIALLLPLPAREVISEYAVSKRYAAYLKTFLERAGCRISVGIGACREGISGLQCSFAEARTALAYTFYESGGAIVHNADVIGFRRQPGPDCIQFETRLIDSLRKGDWDGYYRISRQFFADIIQSKALHPNVLKVRILELLTLLSRTVIEMGGNSSKLLDLKVRLGDEIQHMATISELKEWHNDALREIAYLVQQSQRDFTARAINQAKQYIHQYYAKNISLEELAHHVLLSPHYLSHVFSNVCGMSITEYTKKVRVAKAQALLRKTERPVTEIAALVGYADPNYFARVFKNLTGSSPYQYRKG